jgi:uracil-DNA glycosylase family 4
MRDCAAEAPSNCVLCPRLTSFREANRSSEPAWHNGPVPCFGRESARHVRLLIVGLAPGLRGANRTGRPFTGDYAGDLLYSTLIAYGFARGRYEARADDGLSLVDCMITNAVRCVPPENKPTPAEIGTCRQFLTARLAATPRLAAIVVLGRIAHDSTLAALGLRRAAFPFTHGARHDVRPNLALFDSFHCSRYNTNTGKLTPEMFRAVFAAVKTLDRLSGCRASDSDPGAWLSCNFVLFFDQMRIADTDGRVLAHGNSLLTTARKCAPVHSAVPGPWSRTLCSPTSISGSTWRRARCPTRARAVAADATGAARAM